MKGIWGWWLCDFVQAIQFPWGGVGAFTQTKVSVYERQYVPQNSLVRVGWETFLYWLKNGGIFV